MLGVEEVPVPLPDDGAAGVAVVAAVGTGVLVAGLSVESFFGPDVDSGDSPVGGFILSE
ncbi:MAG TPA: hypothetical protein VLE03_02130 [Nitrospiraceae bacterium]|nr:hypothetical protein [Nitrospiraceae bacterium]